MSSGEKNIDKYTAVLVAQYLKKQGYDETLKSFLRETSIPVSVTGSDNNSDSNIHIDDLKSIISDRIGYNDHVLDSKLKDLTLNEELPPIDNERFHIKRWNFDCNFDNFQSFALDGIPIMVNFCSIESNNLMVSTSSRRLEIFDANLQMVSQLTDQNMKSLGVVKLAGSIPGSDIIYVCLMSGHIYLFDKTYKLITGSSFKPHGRMITHIQFSKMDDNKSWYVLTTSMDNTMNLSILKLKDNTPTWTVTSTIKLLSACTTLNMSKTKVTINGKTVSKTVILLTRMDFTHIVCYTLDDSDILQNCFNIALNNAQFSTHSFNIRDLILINTTFADGSPVINNGTLIGVATSHVPYLRLILLEFPKMETYFQKINDNKQENTGITTYYDKILRNMATQLPQDSYSQPIMRYIPNPNGIIIGTDNGLYAIDLFNGESWQLDMHCDINGQRIKSMEINFSNSALLIGTASKSFHLFKLR
ncbi:similar to Saccharomyces cerevisiae YGR117C Putative protein of unknown function [Maudiozyma barnettii]|uniref:LisH domain-containing protein n=1 Tax=Maudiozyma barnettii TaxID=61262 RepID=A0A8H2ZH82_9SACH|nr:hypothetical protein [Kazachstania barnettii]CAB4251874.1 similar to Saccharomyces cerevisiae YGR117C Putative protein of unknown function [Kazachstania barnettii]CAD1778169.1 similar to Saccharomyces cerevisiae YGR117C Putative protein of unknown function [Kazachstania barnettii]